MHSHNDEAEHDRIRQEVIREGAKEEKPKNGSRIIIVILALIILGAMALWAVPTNIYAPNAKPTRVPSIEEVMLEDMSVPTRPEEKQMIAYLTTTTNVKLIAGRIASQTCSDPSEKCYADALYYFVRDNIQYLNDPVDEYYELPEETLLAQAADCDGHAILLASLMQAVGIQTRFKYTPRHVAVEAWVPTKNVFDKPYVKEWVLYDATCKSCRAGVAP